ncbi:MAG: GlsB/YeaQ/YmgE family stress response membrane protein [Candidatus Woesebacteria bacterium]|nr:MAG: GlsB/YeaQ/YmgE family stress response membrane protein [Candidatus Woesebacteria bacterium]
MNAIIWIAIGIIRGWLIATFVKHSTSNLIDLIFGLVGSLVGAFIASSLIGIPSTSAFTFISAAVGAVVFIFLGRLHEIFK